MQVAQLEAWSEWLLMRLRRIAKTSNNRSVWWDPDQWNSTSREHLVEHICLCNQLLKQLYALGPHYRSLVERSRNEIFRQLEILPCRPTPLTDSGVGNATN